MLLKAGARLGPYEILAPLGAGGMGEVYRARDSRLGRDVAIKILPAAFSADPERLHRFEQEARAAAALNHPNILAVFDLGQHEGAPFIVSELLEGETLREQLTQSEPSGRSEDRPLHEKGSGRASARPTPLSVRKAIEYAIQIAHGLAAAHEKGIVHRDLKPENVFVTSDGRVKILDFGLAKLTLAEPNGPAKAGHYVEGRSVRLQADLSAASTVPPHTTPGLILGTLGYMAPEQVRGLPADHRADIFAFGVVLYEMLAGRRAFLRDTPADTMTAILKDDPPDLPADDRQIPPTLTRIVNRCLEKAPSGRFQSAGDLAFALEAPSSQSGSAPALTAAIPEPRLAGTRDRLAWTLVAIFAVAALALGATMYFRRPPVAVESTRFFVSSPEGWTLARQVLSGSAAAGPLAVAPDGRQVAFVAQNASGGTLIWIRSLDTLAAKGLVGTERGGSPFWSPDSRSLGFFADGKLKKIDIVGGSPVTLCDAAPGISGAWSRDNVIVFSPGPGTALQKVSASGGAPTAATVNQEGEAGHARPFFLPDGRHFLYRAISGDLASRGPVFIGSLDSTERTRLIDVDSTNVIYSQQHLLFLREATLMAQPFDSDRLASTGEAFPVAEQLQVFGAPPYGFFSASDSGVLAYQTGTAAGPPQVTWFDRAGQVLATLGKPAAYRDLALAPDGRRAMVSLAGGQGSSDLWLLDLGRDGLASRFTFDATHDNISPIWSPDGTQVVFSSNRNGRYDLYRKASSGAGSENLLLATNEDKAVTGWSRDGRFLLYFINLTTVSNMWVLPLSGDEKPVPFLQTQADEFDGQFSPDGKWIAYQSNESGRYEAYVAPSNTSGGASGGKWQISTGGGTSPRWRSDGKEIFYVSLGPDTRLMAVAVSAQGATFDVGTVVPLFAVRPPAARSFYQVSPDGKRFLVNMAPVVEGAPTPITVVVNWTAGLKK
jgi:eukaryotic-like serine/threonine-protein kinase